MRELIKICTVLLLSFWIWGVDWSQRNLDEDITKFLVSNEYALALRFILVLTIIIFILLHFKNNIYQYIITLYSGIIGIIILINDSNDETFTIINILISATVFILLTKTNLKFLEKISFKTTNILIFGGLLFLLIFEYSSFVNDGTLFPKMSGLTTINEKRFFGFFGGPIIISSISSLVFIYALKDKTISTFYKIITLAISLNSIILSNSIAGIILLVLYYSLSLTSHFLNNFVIKIPRLTTKNLSLFFIFSVGMVTLFLSQLQTINLFLGKVLYVLLIISGNITNASDLLSYDQFIRSSSSLLGRLGDIEDIFNSMKLSSYIFGSIFSDYRPKYISESGVVSLISIYGIPVTFVYFYIMLKNLGLRLSLIIFLFNIPYNLFLLHPVYLLFSILFKKKNMQLR